MRRGFTWAVDWLADAMATLRSQAEQLGSPEVVRFLEYRAASIREHRLELGPLLKELTTVADAFEPLAD